MSVTLNVTALQVPSTRVLWLLVSLVQYSHIKVGPGKQEDFGESARDMFGAWSFADIAAVREDRNIAVSCVS
jgi:chitinase